MLCKDSKAARGNGEGSHIVTQKAPSWSCPLKERRCPGRKIKRGRCGKFEGGRKSETGRRKHRRKRKSGVCVCVRSLFCHKLLKDYMLPTTHLGLRVKVEEFLLLLNPLEHILLLLFFSFLFALTLSWLQTYANRRSMNVRQSLVLF